LKEHHGPVIKSAKLLVLVTILLGTHAMAIEEPLYTIAGNSGSVEFRLYKPYLVAETEVSGDIKQSDAANVGFRRLFAYISGDNTTNEKLTMTVPVQQERRARKIAMTAPVQQARAPSGWVISFVVPREFDLDTVPIPTNPEVGIRRVPEQMMAALKYSGRWTEENQEKHSSLLLKELEQAGHIPIGTPIAAAYNSPFTPPFMRRNEVLIAVPALP
jgi:hypothetical protein